MQYTLPRPQNIRIYKTRPIQSKGEWNRSLTRESEEDDEKLKNILIFFKSRLVILLYGLELQFREWNYAESHSVDVACYSGKWWS
jgi:hypothetical protein